MKTLLIYILTVLPIVTLGQRSNTIFSTGSNDFLNWTYSDYIKNGINKVECYSYEINNKGKVKKRDSTMLFRKQIEVDSNKIYGIDFDINYQSHGPTFITWHEFQEYYDIQGNLTKYVDRPHKIEKRKEYGDIVWDININETLLEYDDRNLLVKKTYNRIEHSYSVWKRYKDTTYYHSIEPKVYEYEYDLNGNELRNYFTRGKRIYLHPKDFNPSKDSTEIDYRHLNGEKEYDNKGNLTKWIWYTSKNEIHSKKYYFYDEKNQLIKQVDSTGWYLQQYSEDEPSLQSIKTFEYTNNILFKTIESKGDWTYTSEFDEKGNLMNNCLQIADTTDDCTKYKYVYQNSLIEEIQTLPNQKTIFEYNDDGLLIEKRDYLNEKLTSLIKYYYEKENKAYNRVDGSATK